MPESHREAINRARELGIPVSHVVHGEDGYYISPRGVESHGGKEAYASCRDDGGAKDKCARVAHYVDDRAKS